MAVGDVYQCSTIVKTDGQNGAVIQHFEVAGNDGGLNSQQVAADLAAQFVAIKDAWQPIAAADSTFVGNIIQEIWPARGIQFAFAVNEAGAVVGAALPASNSVQMVKRPITKGRAGVGFMSWMGLPQTSVERGRIIEGQMPAWIGFGNLFNSIFNPAGGVGVDWLAGVWSRGTNSFITTNRVDVKAIVGKIANRTPSAVLG